MVERKKRKRGRLRKDRHKDISLNVRLTTACYLSVTIAARLLDKTVTNLLRDLVYDFLEDFSVSTFSMWTAKIDHAVLTIKQLCALTRVTKTPLQDQKAADASSIEIRQRYRGRMLEVGMDSFEQVYKIAKTEQTAKSAKFRVQTYQVLAKLGNFNAAILKSATDEEILASMIELEEENERLETMAKEIQARATQETQSLQQPSTQTERPK